jgi:hypothetical protein
MPGQNNSKFFQQPPEPIIGNSIIIPERTSGPVRPSPFDTPHRVSAHSSNISKKFRRALLHDRIAL